MYFSDFNSAEDVLAALERDSLWHNQIFELRLQNPELITHEVLSLSYQKEFECKLDQALGGFLNFRNREYGDFDSSIECLEGAENLYLNARGDSVDLDPDLLNNKVGEIFERSLDNYKACQALFNHIESNPDTVLEFSLQNYKSKLSDSCAELVIDYYRPRLKRLRRQAKGFKKLADTNSKKVFDLTKVIFDELYAINTDSFLGGRLNGSIERILDISKIKGINYLQIVQSQLGEDSEKKEELQRRIGSLESHLARFS